MARFVTFHRLLGDPHHITQTKASRLRHTWFALIKSHRRLALLQLAPVMLKAWKPKKTEFVPSSLGERLMKGRLELGFIQKEGARRMAGSQTAPVRTDPANGCSTTQGRSINLVGLGKGPNDHVQEAPGPGQRVHWNMDKWLHAINRKRWKQIRFCF